MFLAAALAGCSTEAAVPAERAWEADLDGYLEFAPADVCAGRTTDATRTTAVAEGTMGDLGSVAARMSHCPSDSGVYYDGDVTFTTQEGDELQATYDGVTDDFAADPRSWPMQITGGTGRFANASGTVFLMSYELDWGTSPPGWVGHFEGTVSY
jgi:hypothetical protein